MKFGVYRKALAASLFITAVGTAQAASLTVSSTSFNDGQTIPVRIAGAGAACGDGQGLSPQISWAHAPSATRSLAIVLFDPDGGKGLGVAHLVAYNIDPVRGEIDEGDIKHGMPGVTVGRNMVGATAYRGLCPPPGDNPHHYVTTVIATDLAPGSLPEGLDHQQLLAELKDHALAGQSITGIYGH